MPSPKSTVEDLAGDVLVTDGSNARAAWATDDLLLALRQCRRSTPADMEANPNVPRTLSGDHPTLHTVPSQVYPSERLSRPASLSNSTSADARNSSFHLSSTRTLDIVDIRTGLPGIRW